jgi:hypothetical protein
MSVSCLPARYFRLASMAIYGMSSNKMNLRVNTCATAFLQVVFSDSANSPACKQGTPPSAERLIAAHVILLEAQMENRRSELIGALYWLGSMPSAFLPAKRRN